MMLSMSHAFSSKDENSAVFQTPDNFPIYCSITSGLTPFTVEWIPQFLADMAESLYRIVPAVLISHLGSVFTCLSDCIFV